MTTTQLWGVDPMFRSHVKMYLQDVLSMEPVDTYPGVFLYHGRPVTRVDISGVVVKIEDRDKFISYGLDDGTGVMSCTHWKPDRPVNTTTPAIGGKLAEKWRQLKEDRYECLRGYSLGQLLHVRGKLSVFNNNIQVVASYCTRVSDVVEMDRMLQLPRLYNHCYNHANTLPKALASADLTDSEKLHDVETLVMSQQWEMFTKDDLVKLVDSDRLSEKNEISNTVHKVLTNMRQHGQVIHIGGHVYAFYDKCEDLRKTIMKIIAAWSEQNEDGCSDTFIQDKLHRCVQWAEITRIGLHRCLDQMEADSCVISTDHRKYITFNI